MIVGDAKHDSSDVGVGADGGDRDGGAKEGRRGGEGTPHDHCEASSASQVQGFRTFLGLLENRQGSVLERLVPSAPCFIYWILGRPMSVLW